MNSKNEITKIFENLKGNVFVKQLAAGTVTGLVSGNFAQKLGKPVAFTAGAGIILLEIAHYKGLINMSLTDLQRQAKDKSEEFKNRGEDCPPNKIPVEKIREFATNNKTFTAGFVGGFLMGIAW